jgi:protocatechuate 3,4-dioxygenase beta subunit
MISGTVFAPDGKPLEGAHVSARAQESVQDPMGRSYGNGRTDAKGDFEIYALQKNEYVVEASYEGYYCDEVVVAAGATGVRVDLRRAGRVHGIVMGDDGRPVSGAQIRAVVRDGDDERHSAWDQTSAEGRFELKPLPPDGTVELHVDHDAYASQVVRAVPTTGVERRITLASGVRVEGRVADREGRGIASASVVVMYGGHSKQVTADASGAFVAGGLETGPGRDVGVAGAEQPAGGKGIRVKLDSSPQGHIPTEPIEVAPGTRVRIVAELGATISGRVVGADGKPVNGVRVKVVGADGNEHGDDWVWRDDGKFTVRGLRAGVYTLIAERWGGGELTQIATRPGVAAGDSDVEIRATE